MVSAIKDVMRITKRETNPAGYGKQKTKEEPNMCWLDVGRGRQNIPGKDYGGLR